jgi:hypothetical protein
LGNKKIVGEKLEYTHHIEYKKLYTGDIFGGRYLLNEDELKEK